MGAPSSDCPDPFEHAKLELSLKMQQPVHDTASSPNLGVAVPLKKHQRISMTPGAGDHVYLVTYGVVLVEGKLPEQRRQVLEILYDGDIYPTQDAPEFLATALVASTASELRRLKQQAAEALSGNQPEFARRIAAASAVRGTRRTIHLASISRPSGEERLADFLVEMGLHLGRPVVSGRMFDLPLSRDDIADYLALNPDTLSRLFSRLKAKRMIAISQGRATVADWEALCRLSPLSGPLVELSKRCRSIE